MYYTGVHRDWKNKITVLIILHPKPRLNFKYFRATSCLSRTRNVAGRERGQRNKKSLTIHTSENESTTLSHSYGTGVPPPLLKLGLLLAERSNICSWRRRCMKMFYVQIKHGKNAKFGWTVQHTLSTWYWTNMFHRLAVALILTR